MFTNYSAFHSIQRKWGGCEPFPPGDVSGTAIFLLNCIRLGTKVRFTSRGYFWHSCAEEECTGSFCRSLLPRQSRHDSSDAHLAEGRFRAPGKYTPLRDSVSLKSHSWHFVLKFSAFTPLTFFFASSLLFLLHCTWNCVCIGGWGRDAKSCFSSKKYTL